jgi:hypothetical protein
MTDQPGFGLVTGLAGNPPYAFPVSFTPSTAIPFVSFGDAYTLAGGSVSPYSVAANYKDAYVQQWNMGIEQQLGESFKLTARYVGSKGTDLNIERNYNQLVNGVHPYLALSATSPIDPGLPLSTITVSESDGNSSYNALWVRPRSVCRKGCSLSLPRAGRNRLTIIPATTRGSLFRTATVSQCDRGLSDFNAKSRTTISGIYQLPFKGNRFKEGLAAFVGRNDADRQSAELPHFQRRVHGPGAAAAERRTVRW